MSVNNKITVYSKSGCINCDKVKSYLVEIGQDFVTINCDEELATNKAGFLENISKLAHTQIKTFPIVFIENDIYIGGYADTIHYFEL